MVSFHVFGLQECHFRRRKEKKKKSRQVHRGSCQRTGCPNYTCQNAKCGFLKSLWLIKGIYKKLKDDTVVSIPPDNATSSMNQTLVKSKSTSWKIFYCFWNDPNLRHMQYVQWSLYFKTMRPRKCGIILQVVLNKGHLKTCILGPNQVVL